MPEEFNSMSTGKVLLVRRFDRGADGTRVHVEDVAQLFGRYPSEKYTLRASIPDAALTGSFRGLASSYGRAIPSSFSRASIHFHSSLLEANRSRRVAPLRLTRS